MPAWENLVFVSVISPAEMAMSALLNRVASLGGRYVASQQIFTQEKSAIVLGNGKGNPQMTVRYIHTIYLPKQSIEGVTGAPYDEFALVDSSHFFKGVKNDVA